MAPSYDSLISITDNKSKWCFFARIVRLWSTTDSYSSEKSTTIHLILMDNHGHKIHAMVGRELYNKFKFSLKEEAVFIMYNFRVVVNEIQEVMTTSHRFCLNFTDKTKIKPVDHGIVPYYSYFFTHPSVFLSNSYKSEVMVDVIGMLAKVGVEDEYIFDGVMTKIISMDLENNGYRFKCILHGHFVDDLTDFILSGSSDNACVVIFLGKIKLWKGIPTVQNHGVYTKMLFNPKFNVVEELKDRMVDKTFSPYKAIYASPEETWFHNIDQWVYSTGVTTLSALRICPTESMSIIMATVDQYVTDGGWWFLSCVCHEQVVPDSPAYYCQRCNSHVLMITPRYRITFRVTDNTGSATFIMHDSVAAEFFGIPCSKMLEFRENVGMRSYVPDELLNMVGKCYLFKVFSKVGAGRDGEKCYPISKINDDEELLGRFQRHNSEVIKLDMK